MEQYESESPAISQQTILRTLANFMVSLDAFEQNYSPLQEAADDIALALRPGNGHQRRDFIREHNNQLYKAEILAGQNTVNEFLLAMGGLEVRAVSKGDGNTGRPVNLTLTAWHGVGEKPGYHRWSGQHQAEPFEFPLRPVVAELNSRASQLEADSTPHFRQDSRY